MTYNKDFASQTEYLDQITSDGLDILPESIEVLISTAMKAERSNHLKADLYERSDRPNEYAMATSEKRSRPRSETLPLMCPRSGMDLLSRRPGKEAAQ
jgi:hypothetical protein